MIENPGFNPQNRRKEKERERRKKKKQTEREGERGGMGRRGDKRF